MSRNSKPPFIPPLKLSVSEDAVVRGRPQNVRHAPAMDDLPDPQAGGESSRREHSRDSSADKPDEAQGKPTAAVQPEALDKVELEQARTQGDKQVKEAKSKTTSRVRELINQFDTTTRTVTRASRLPTRNGNVLDLGETAKSGKARNYDSSGKSTPRDDSDVDPSLPDAGEWTDSSISGLLTSEEETNQNSRRLRQTEENETSMESRKNSGKTMHHRNRSAGTKSRLGFVETSSKDRMSRSHKSPRSFASNASVPPWSVAADVACQASKQSRLPVSKSETRTLKDLTGREATGGSHRPSPDDYSPRQMPPNNSTKILVRWDGSPAKGGPSIGATGESSRSGSRTRAHRKATMDATNPPSDKATELSGTDHQPEEQDRMASFVVHDPSPQPPCTATNRPVFAPTGSAVGVESDLPNHNMSNGCATIVKLEHGLSCFLSVLWAIPAKAFILAMAVATWIVRLLQRFTACNCIRVIRNRFSCPQPSSPRQSSQEQPEDQTGIGNCILHNRRFQGFLLLFVLFCQAFLAIDFCDAA